MIICAMLHRCAQVLMAALIQQQTCSHDCNFRSSSLIEVVFRPGMSFSIHIASLQTGLPVTVLFCLGDSAYFCVYGVTSVKKKRCIDAADLVGFECSCCSFQVCQHTKHVIPELVPYRT